MKKRNIFATMMAAVLTLLSVACTSPDDKEGFPSIVLTNDNSISESSYQEHDPLAAYAMAFSIAARDGYFVVEGGSTYPNARYGNILGTSIARPTAVSIADWGTSRNLKSVNTYPTEGYTNTLPIEEDHAYVVKCTPADGQLNYESYPEIHAPADLYIRIYVEEQTEEGWKVRYNYPFVVE